MRQKDLKQLLPDEGHQKKSLFPRKNPIKGFLLPEQEKKERKKGQSI